MLRIFRLSSKVEDNSRARAEFVQSGRGGRRRSSAASTFGLNARKKRFTHKCPLEACHLLGKGGGLSCRCMAEGVRIVNTLTKRLDSFVSIYP